MSGFVIVIGCVVAGLLLSRVVRMAYEHDRIIRRVDAMLTVWATYGTWNAECQAALAAVLETDRAPAVDSNERRPRPPPPTSMGMDFGLGELWCRLMGRERWR